MNRIPPKAWEAKLDRRTRLYSRGCEPRATGLNRFMACVALMFWLLLAAAGVVGLVGCSSYKPKAETEQFPFRTMVDPITREVPRVQRN